MKFSELIEEIHMRTEHDRNILWNEGKIALKPLHELILKAIFERIATPVLFIYTIVNHHKMELSKIKRVVTRSESSFKCSCGIIIREVRFNMEMVMVADYLIERYP